MTTDSQKRLLDVLLPRIDAARAWAGLDVEEMREMAGIAHTTAKRWAHYEAVPTLLQLIAIACVCDVSLAFFLVDVDEARERIHGYQQV